MKINIAFKEKSQSKMKEGLKMSEFLILYNNKDIVIERCDVIGDNGQYINSLDLNSIKTMVAQYI